MARAIGPLSAASRRVVTTSRPAPMSIDTVNAAGAWTHPANRPAVTDSGFQFDPVAREDEIGQHPLERQVEAAARGEVPAARRCRPTRRW